LTVSKRSLAGVVDLAPENDAVDFHGEVGIDFADRPDLSRKPGYFLVAVRFEAGWLHQPEEQVTRRRNIGCVGRANEIDSGSG
jgi:hypothetical protein